MTDDRCAPCGCRYYSPAINLFCRDTGCDCHHEPPISGTPHD